MGDRSELLIDSIDDPPRSSSRHMIQRKVASAELRGTIYGYVEVRAVLRVEPKPAATASTDRPTKKPVRLGRVG
jgi:hypothetical protein